jgi:hypothetical protein
VAFPEKDKFEWKKKKLAGSVLESWNCKINTEKGDKKLVLRSLSKTIFFALQFICLGNEFSGKFIGTDDELKQSFGQFE